jgi:hypothetical protein
LLDALRVGRRCAGTLKAGKAGTTWMRVLDSGGLCSGSHSHGMHSLLFLFTVVFSPQFPV